MATPPKKPDSSYQDSPFVKNHKRLAAGGNPDVGAKSGNGTKQKP